MKVLYLDAQMGAAGDMIAGALVDSGVPLEVITEPLGKLNLPGLTVETYREKRSGIMGMRFVVGSSSSDTHRSINTIRKLISEAGIDPGTADLALRTFQRLADVEAAMHGIDVDEVHFHEVGAVDSIADIVGVSAAVTWLKADRIIVSPVRLGSGTVKCEHGLMPVPAPATAALLKGVPVFQGDVAFEMTTPTAAALLTELAHGFGPLPTLSVSAIGYGAGSREIPDFPNLFRLIVGDEVSESAASTVLVMEANVDDMNPQNFQRLSERMYEAGALEVFLTPVQMKKARPGTLITILAAVSGREKLESILFEESSTLGYRYREESRVELGRSQMAVQTEWGEVRVKTALRQDEVIHFHPEYDDCLRLAREHGVPVKNVQNEAIAAYLQKTKESS